MADISEELIQTIHKLAAIQPAHLMYLYKMMVPFPGKTWEGTMMDTHPILPCLDTVAKLTGQFGLPVLYALMGTHEKSRELLGKLTNNVRSELKKIKGDWENSKKDRTLSNQMTAMTTLLRVCENAMRVGELYKPAESNAVAVHKWGFKRVFGQQDYIEPGVSGLQNYTRGGELFMSQFSSHVVVDNKNVIVEDLCDAMRDAAPVDLDDAWSAAEHEMEALFAVYYVYGTIMDRKSAPMLAMFRDLETINDSVRESWSDRRRLIELSKATERNLAASREMCAAPHLFRHTADFVASHALRHDGRLRYGYDVVRDLSAMGELADSLKPKTPLKYKFLGHPEDFMKRDINEKYTGVDILDDQDIIGRGDEDRGEEDGPFYKMGVMMRKTANNFLVKQGLKKKAAKKKRDDTDTGGEIQDQAAKKRRDSLYAAEALAGMSQDAEEQPQSSSSSSSSSDMAPRKQMFAPRKQIVARKTSAWVPGTDSQVVDTTDDESDDEPTEAELQPEEQAEEQPEDRMSDEDLFE